MQKIILSVCFIFFFDLGLFAQCVNPANIYTFTYNGKNYELVKEKKNWTDAATCAASRGGYLVQIDDSSEQAAMVTALTASGISTTYNPISDGGGTSYVWIGATDKATEGIWLWDGNNDGTGTNFWSGEGAAGQNNGAVLSGRYINWGGKASGTINEPDNFGGLQDAAALALAAWPAGSGALGAAVPGAFGRWQPARDGVPRAHADLHQPWRISFTVQQSCVLLARPVVQRLPAFAARVRARALVLQRDDAADAARR